MVPQAEEAVCVHKFYSTESVATDGQVWVVFMELPPKAHRTFFKDAEKPGVE
jgi:hypothetical protein